MASELDLAAILCTLLLGGEAESAHAYGAAGERRHIRVDCETPTHVVEVGLDRRRSSYDSLHQALFAAELTGKLPMIVMIDTNGIEEAAEYQVETVARAAGIAYLTFDEDYLVRWQMTWPFRQARNARLARSPDPAMN